MKYILITGGVISGIGKGIISSSIGTIMKAFGWNVTCIKIDPYLNLDAGTFSPYEHGEVYVLDDGSEVDLDLGNYERYLDVTLTKDNNITTGKVYKKVMERERRGDYLGKTVQIVPHLTDAIMEWVCEVSQIPVDGSNQIPELCIIELGGTIGDIESMPFVEAFRQLLFRVGSENFCCVHVSLVPQLAAVGEPKTKPTQASVRELRAAGLHPDILMCRCNAPLPRSVIDKISLFSQVPVNRVITVMDSPCLYEVPLQLEGQYVCQLLLDHFHLEPKRVGCPGLGKWEAITRKLKQTTKPVRVAVVGKYTKLNDAYLSLLKALEHAAIYANHQLAVDLIYAENLEEATRVNNPDNFHRAWLSLSNCHAVVVPGGFGKRALAGKLVAIQFCRERGVPFLGICLGLQCAVIEFARNVLGLKDANSFEFAKENEHKLVIDMPEYNPQDMGGTMRLGRRRTSLFLSTTASAYIDRTYGRTELPKSGMGDTAAGSAQSADSIVHRLVNAPYFDARHRHRYEVNPAYVDQLESAGLLVVGRDAEVGDRMEVIELLRPVSEEARSVGHQLGSRHPFFVATQFHPEYTSRPMHPSPFFVGLLLAACGRLAAYLQQPFRLSPTQLLLDDDEGPGSQMKASGNEAPCVSRSTESSPRMTADDKTVASNTTTKSLPVIFTNGDVNDKI